MDIKIETGIYDKLPDLVLGGFLAKVKVSKSSEELVELIEKHLNELTAKHDPQSIRDLATVKSLKEAYKKLGKDPNRYRPSAESLLRRIAKGNGLYQINNVVDILNLISVITGYSICGYDYDKIFRPISLGIGENEEPYVGIGRGELNIEKLPVFRDEVGAFGTPTSDSVRTQITYKTENILFIFITFDDNEYLNRFIEKSVSLINKFAEGKLTEKFIIKR